MTNLTHEKLHEVAHKALYAESEMSDVDGVRAIPKGAIIVKGAIHTFGFHPRVREMKSQIDAMLRDLPDDFQKDKGGGGAFIAAFQDKDGNHWGEHRDIEMLVALGIAVGSASWLGLDGPLASVLQVGGLPYFEVHPDPVLH